MSGHSKWAKIHRDKDISDQKRGQSFTKLSNAITLAVREGGNGDPEFNFKLRLAIERARSFNMPKDNIQRAVDKALGKGGVNTLEEVMYEGYGPSGVGILVLVVTDNKMRTVQEVKNIFDRSGGSIASPGAVSFNFKKVGFVLIEVGDKSEEATLKIMDLGIDDIEDEGDGNLGVYVPLDNLMSFKDRVLALGYQVKNVEIIMKPINLMPINEKRAALSVISLIEKLEALDDVQKVFANFDIPDEYLNSSE